MAEDGDKNTGPLIFRMDGHIIGRASIREPDPSPAKVIGVAAIASISAFSIWTWLLLADRASPFPPNLMQALPPAFVAGAVLISIGAFFRDFAWLAGFVAALVHVLCSAVLAWIAMSAASSSSHVDYTSLVVAFLLPAPLYPIAAGLGSLGVRHAPRPWMFWVAYAFVVAITVLAVQWTAASA